MEKFRDLPPDIVEEIMSRLQPESLLKLKRVGKSWYALIHGLMRDRSFIYKNLMNNKAKAYQLSDPEDYFSLKIFNNMDIKNRGAKSISKVVEDLKPLLGEWLEKALVAGHCNGIIYFVNYDEDSMLLCNPTTKRVKYLRRRAPSNSTHRVSLAVGLGYDRIANVYKVVKIYHEPCREAIAMVHTLGDHQSEWREINLRVKLRSYSCLTIQGLSCNGAYNWVASIDTPTTGYEEALLSFDIHDEALRSVAFLPNKIKNIFCFLHTIRVSSSFNRLRILQWNGSVGLLLSSSPNKGLEVWVLNCPLDHSQPPVWTVRHFFEFYVHRGRDICQPQSLDREHFPMTGPSVKLLYHLLTDDSTLSFEVEREFFRSFGFVPSLVSLAAGPRRTALVSGMGRR